MTKKFTASVLPLVPVALFLALSGFSGNLKDPFLEMLHKRLDWYNHAFYTEKSYLITDRFSYRPGEDIWFQGYVFSVNDIRTDSGSEDLFVKLLDNKGDEIISRRYPISEHQATGRFLIPRNAIPGKYYLVAYTGWMKNLSSRYAFKKEILIGKFFDKRFQADVLYDRDFYYPNDSMHAVLKIIDASGKPIAATDFIYTIGSFKKGLLKGYGRTTPQGNFNLSFQVPQSEDILTMTIELKSRKSSGDYTVILPVASGVKTVSFQSEDGNIISGVPNFMTFRCQTRYGLPVEISGSIIDRNGHVFQTVRSDSKGIGSFTYIPSPDTCFLQILKPEGIKKLFSLPLASQEGSQLHLQHMDKDTATFRLSVTGQSSDSIFHWTAIQNRNIVWSGTSQGKSTIKKIPVALFLKGISEITVFDNSYNVVARRFINIPSHEMLRVKTDRQVYQSRQRVVLTLDYSGNSSKVDITTAISLRQLSYNPNLPDFDQSTLSYPDDTIGLNWTKVLGKESEKASYTKNEGLYGYITDRKENPAQHAKVRVTHLPNYRFYETQSDENGFFSVSFGSDVIDFNYLKVDAYDALGKVNLQASVNQDYARKIREDIIRESENMDRQKIVNTSSYGDPELIYSLRYSSRKYMKSENESRRRYDPKLYADYANALDIVEDLHPFIVKNNLIVFTDSVPVNVSQHIQEGVIIVINGAIKGTNAEILKSLIPSDITNINVSESLADVHRYTPVNFQGVIELTTIQGMYKYRQPGVQVGMDIMNTSRVFYSPDYSIENPSNTDNRRTLYWNPRITISKGIPSLVTFYTSDIKGVFYGKIVGIDAEGHPVEADFTITVE